MKAIQIIRAIEKVAPLSFQDDFDNSGLQVGSILSDVDKVLVCLDVTEEVVDEAIAGGCQMIVSHHPLLFHPLKQVCGFTYQQRCVIKALGAGVAIYSAHTSLDNAPGGVNHKMAEIIGLQDIQWLQPKDGGVAGSGLVGMLPVPETDCAFLRRLKELFKVESLRHSECSGALVSKVAVCGGAGAFLLREALAQDADCFITGELHYHDFFENGNTLLAELGHYQSEQFTIDLLCSIIAGACPDVTLVSTTINTNPIRYDSI